jgi:hypothetical protein
MTAKSQINHQMGQAGYRWRSDGKFLIVLRIHYIARVDNLLHARIFLCCHLVHLLNLPLQFLHEIPGNGPGGTFASVLGKHFSINKIVRC